MVTFWHLHAIISRIKNETETFRVTWSMTWDILYNIRDGVEIIFKTKP